jgi:hypothetical protein
LRDLWAITSYFNPAKYQRRRLNYRSFRQRLNAPLLTVELSGDGEFEVGRDEADLLIRVRGEGVMWQKERLLNLGLAALPPSCTKVAWLDCDIVFERKDWADQASRLLDRFTLVQPFSSAYPALPKDWCPGRELPAGSEEWRGVPWLLCQGMSIAEGLDTYASVIRSSQGLAWAARREVLEANSFYDANIVGGGDALMVRAAYGRFEAAMSIQEMNEAQRDHYMRWARGYHRDVAGKVAHVDGSVFHLWHGDKANRGYRERFTGLRHFGYDPFSDIAIDHGGAWRWNTDKPDLHAYVRSYFLSRKEDG